MRPENQGPAAEKLPEAVNYVMIAMHTTGTRRISCHILGIKLNGAVTVRATQSKNIARASAALRHMQSADEWVVHGIF